VGVQASRTLDFTYTSTAKVARRPKLTIWQAFLYFFFQATLSNAFYIFAVYTGCCSWDEKSNSLSHVLLVLIWNYPYGRGPLTVVNWQHLPAGLWLQRKGVNNIIVEIEFFGNWKNYPVITVSRTVTAS